MTDEILTTAEYFHAVSAKLTEAAYNLSEREEIRGSFQVASELEWPSDPGDIESVLRSQAYSMCMREVSQAIRLLEIAADRLQCMGYQVEGDGKISRSWDWFDAKHGIRGKKIALHFLPMHGHDEDGSDMSDPSKLMLSVSPWPRDMFEAETIASLLQRHGFEQYKHGKYGDDDAPCWYSKDRAPDALRQIDSALNELGYAYINWTGDAWIKYRHELEQIEAA